MADYPPNQKCLQGALYKFNHTAPEIRIIRLTLLLAAILIGHLYAPHLLSSHFRSLPSAPHSEPFHHTMEHTRLNSPREISKTLQTNKQAYNRTAQFTDIWCRK